MALAVCRCLIACLYPFAHSAVAVETLVDLSYGKFEGATLSGGIIQWLGIPYAAPPIHELRFSPPGDPQKKSGVQQAKKASHPHEPLRLQP